ncbi:MAG: dienelactone hydrolase family protein [Nitrosopumilus sp.]|nr:dienelactone hydrolase family protein [Nitrosopumilus sp.]
MQFIFMRALSIIVILVVLMIPLSPAFASWHWSSPWEVCGTQVIKKGEKCDLGLESKKEISKPSLKQIQETTKSSNITCTNGLELVMKLSNGKPACVKPSSVEKLIQRGWAIHVLPDYEKNENNNSVVFTTGSFEVDNKVVQYSDGTNGYLSKPSVEGNFPGIIMIHEWWGLNDNIKEMAEKLASHGYVVLAVDLYEGQIGTTPEEARQLVNSFDRTEWISNMDSALSYLDEQYSPTNMGSIGWCLGGGQSLQLALNNDEMDATVIYYGSLVTDSEELSSIDWPVLGIFAELDQGIPPEQVNEFEAALNELEIPNEIHMYSDVNHAFANPSGERYAPDASMDAWQKTLEFFERNLK